VAVQRNEDMRVVVSKPKPRVERVKSLVHRTLASRRMAVLSDRSGDLVEKYPHLRKPNYVRYFIFCGDMLTSRYLSCTKVRESHVIDCDAATSSQFFFPIFSIVYYISLLFDSLFV